MTSPGLFNAALFPKGGIMQQLYQLVKSDWLVTRLNTDLRWVRGASTLGLIVFTHRFQSLGVVVRFRGDTLSFPGAMCC